MSHALHFVTQLSKNTCFVLNWYLLECKLGIWLILSSSLPLSYLLNHNSILSNLNCMWDLTSNCEYFRAEKIFKCFKPGSKLPSTFQLLVLDIRRWNIKEKIAILQLYQYQTLINSVMKYIWEIMIKGI